MHIAVSALIRVNGLLLLCLRKTGPYPFTWEFPTVEREENETIEDAIERHLFMELGLLTENNKIIRRMEIPVFAEPWVFYLVECEVVGGNFELGMYADACLIRQSSTCFFKFWSPLVQKIAKYV